MKVFFPRRNRTQLDTVVLTLPARGTVTGESGLAGQTVRGNRVEIPPRHEPWDHVLSSVKKKKEATSASDQTNQMQNGN